MPSTSATAVKDVLAELESLGDEKRRQFNAKTARDGIAGVPTDKQFGCKTGDLRKLAKKLKTDHELGQKLWKTGNMDAQMLAILIMNPKELSAKELDTMVRETRFSWVTDWLQSYIIKHQSDAEKEKLRKKWMKKSEKDSWVSRAGWHLAASMINKGQDVGDVDALLVRLEKEMPKARPETQWTMNNTLGAIGMNLARHRKRAVAIGEKIGPLCRLAEAKAVCHPLCPGVG